MIARNDVMATSSLFRRINYVLMYVFVRRQRQLMLDRANYQENNFVEELAKDCPSHQIASLIWSRIQEESDLIESDFKPKPEDILGKHFGIENEDVRDLVIDLAKACEKECPAWEEIEVEQIGTVRDLARFIFKLRDANG